jgi:hypothetical protein
MQGFRVAVVAVVLALAGCGGSSDRGPQTYDGDGYSFTYPGNWSERDATAETGEVDVLIAPSRGKQGISVTVFEVEKPVTEETFDELEPVIRAAAEQFLANAAGGKLEGEVVRTTVAGLPGVRFEGTTSAGGGVRTKETWIFDGTTAYAFNCQSDLDGSDEVDRACATVLDSFAPG